MAAKTWIEKRDLHSKPHQVKTTDKKFADIPMGSRMLIATPKIIEEYIREIPFGDNIELLKIREDLARAYKADKTCPVTTGIFFRTVCEAAYEEYQAGKNENDITPFWRVHSPKTEAKFTGGTTFIERQRNRENRLD